MDKIVNLFKWPAAILAVWSLFAFYQSIDYFNLKNLRFIAMIGGIVMFFVARASMDKDVRVSMQILAHELTHSFFALLTFHKVRHIRIHEDNSGGSMGFLGKGNWLITIGPYFFPLFCFFFMIGAHFYMRMGGEFNWVISAVFGYFVGYHIDTVSSQIHEKQTDLPKVGYKFCWVFLPGANFWMIGSMLAFNSNGWSSLWLYQKLIWKLNVDNLFWAVGYLTNS